MSRVSNNISYKGIVNVSLVRNGRTIKTFKQYNKGYSGLFNYIISCLARDIATTNCPKYIRCFHLDSENLPSSEDLVMDSAIGYSVVTPNPNTNSVTYQFAIPSTGLNVAERSFNYVGLYSPSKKDILNEPSALAELSTPIQLEDIEEGTNIIINWTLTFSNKGGE